MKLSVESYSHVVVPSIRNGCVYNEILLVKQRDLSLTVTKVNKLVVSLSTTKIAAYLVVSA
jgi:hypothetical protein